jgi:hypothetical protein
MEDTPVDISMQIAVLDSLLELCRILNLWKDTQMTYRVIFPDIVLENMDKHPRLPLWKNVSASSDDCSKSMAAAGEPLGILRRQQQYPLSTEL